MNKAIFLDRDGVINRERGTYTWSLTDFELLPDLISGLSILKERGFRFIIITNQGGIDLNLYHHSDVALVHNYLLDKLQKAGIFVDEIFYCPHHPSKTKCLCRKPDSLLVEKAIKKYNIDRQLSYFIGDKVRDTEAAEKVGVKGILIESNSSILDILDRII